MVQKGMPVKEDTETPEENNVDKIKLAKCSSSKKQKWV